MSESWDGIKWGILYDARGPEPGCEKCKAHAEWWDNFYGDPDDEEETKDAPPECDEHVRAVAFFDLSDQDPTTGGGNE